MRHADECTHQRYVFIGSAQPLITTPVLAQLSRQRLDPSSNSLAISLDLCTTRQATTRKRARLTPTCSEVLLAIQSIATIKSGCTVSSWANLSCAVNAICDICNFQTSSLSAVIAPVTRKNDQTRAPTQRKLAIPDASLTGEHNGHITMASPATSGFRSRQSKQTVQTRFAMWARTLGAQHCTRT